MKKRFLLLVSMLSLVFGSIFSQTLIPAPNVNAVQTFCEGANATVANLQAQALPGYTINWYASTTGFDILPYDMPLVNEAVYYACHRNGDSESERAAVTVMITPSPVVGSISIAPICSQQPLQQPTEPTINWNGSTGTVRWEIGQGSFTEITFPYTVSDSDNGKIIRFTAGNNCGESAPATAVLTVNPLPTHKLTDPAPFCEGAVEIEPSKNIPGNTINWNGSSEPQVTNQKAVTSPNQFNYTVTNENGCTGALQTYTVIVEANPSIPTVNNNVVYYRDGIQSDNKFKNLLSQDAGAVEAAPNATLYWFDENSSTWGTTLPTPPTPAIGDYDDKAYTYLVKQKLNTAFGCESEQATIVAHIYLIPIPKVRSISYCIDETPVQIGESTVEIDPTGGYQKSDFELRWYGAGNTPTFQTYSTTRPTPSTTSAGTTSYWVSQYNKITGAESSLVSIGVTVHPGPNIPVNGNTTICLGDTVYLEATGADAYLWDNGVIDSFMIATPVTNTTYYVTGINYYANGVYANGCSNTDSVFVTVLPKEFCGYTDRYAENYDSLAIVNNNSCIYKKIEEPITGCTDTLALNYNPVATITDNDACVYGATGQEPVYGCTDPRALNYNPQATEYEEKSCVYPDEENTHNETVTETPVDTVGAKPLEDCQLGAGLSISATISDITPVDDQRIIVHWEITQNGNTIYYDVEYSIRTHGVILFYLSIICKNGTLKSSNNDVTGYIVSAAYYVPESIFTGIYPPEGEANNHLTVYPNPFTDILNVLVKDTKVSNIALYSVEGKLLANYPNLNEVQIATSKLSSGVYVVKVTADGKIETVTVVKK